MFLMMMKQLLCCMSPSGDEIAREDVVPAPSLPAPVMAHTSPVARAPMRIRPLPSLPSPSALEARDTLTPSSAPAVEGTLPVVVSAQALVTVEDILGSVLTPALTIQVDEVQELRSSVLQKQAGYLEVPDLNTPSTLSSTRARFPPFDSSWINQESRQRPTCEPRRYSTPISSTNADEDHVPSPGTQLLNKDKVEAPAGQVVEADLSPEDPDLPFPFPASRFGFHDISTTLIKRLGKGGFGTVFLGHSWVDNTLQAIAIKVCPAEDVEMWEAEVARNLEAEGSGTCPMIGFGRSEGSCYISLALADAGDLTHYWLEVPLEARPSKALGIIHDALVVLGKLHSLGIAHFDIKSDNLLVDTKAGIWVADLGLALPLESDGLVHVKGGTPGYMAPEVYRGQRAGPSADVYALGAVLYWLLTGHQLIPFSPDRQVFHNTRLQGVMPQHFDHPVFDGMTGRYLQVVVESFCSDDPARRPKATAAAEQLAWLQQVVSEDKFQEQPAAAPPQVSDACSSVGSIGSSGSFEGEDSDDGCVWEIVVVA